MKLTSIMKYTLYNIVKRRPINIKNIYLPLYQSRVFQDTDFNENFQKAESNQRYKEFLPYLLLAPTDIYKPKYLITSLQFNPEHETLQITSLRARGILKQQFNVNNIIPITYADMRAYSKYPEPLLPTYIDQTMTYFNRFNLDTYVFEFDGTWNQQTVNHPKLSLQNRLNQKQWFDRRHAY